MLEYDLGYGLEYVLEYMEIDTCLKRYIFL